MATSDAVRRYEGPQPVRMSYPEGWTLQEKEDTVSLWKSREGGAITISSVVNQDPEHRGNALEQCRRFAEKHAFDPPRMSGDAEAAAAAFTDHDGVWCKVKILAAGPRMLLATYNTESENPAEEDEVEAIFATLAIATS